MPSTFIALFYDDKNDNSNFSYIDTHDIRQNLSIDTQIFWTYNLICATSPNNWNRHLHPSLKSSYSALKIVDSSSLPYFKYTQLRADIILPGSFRYNNTNNNAQCNVERQTTLHTLHCSIQFGLIIHTSCITTINIERFLNGVSWVWTWTQRMEITAAV